MTAQTGLAVSRDASSNGTTPKGFRLGVGALLAKNGASGLDVRTGVLWDNGAAVVAGTAAMSYTVRACNSVVMPSSTQGPVIVPNDASVTVTTTAAPGSNSRIDSIWVRQHLVAADGGADTDVVAEIGVTQGTASASPSVPAIPSGAVELARATVTAGATATNTLTISQTHPWTCADGAPIPVRNNTERGALSAYTGMLVNNLNSGLIERYDGSTWVGVGLKKSNAGTVANITLTTGQTSITTTFAHGCDGTPAVVGTMSGTTTSAIYLVKTSSVDATNATLLIQRADGAAMTGQARDVMWIAVVPR